jgi:hypothetical protein
MTHFPKITIKKVPHNRQKYNTIGDYNKAGVIRISKMNFKMEACAALHELVEFALIKKNGIKIKDIEIWDKKHHHILSPGELRGAPYYKEHMFAEKLERLFAKQLCLKWKDYDKMEEKLHKKYCKK